MASHHINFALQSTTIKLPDTSAFSSTLPRAKYILVNLETLGLFVPSLFSPHRGIPKLKTIFGNYFSVSNFECLSLRLGSSIINLYGSVIEFVISLGACTIILDGFLFCDKIKNFRSAVSKTFFAINLGENLSNSKYIFFLNLRRNGYGDN